MKPRWSAVASLVLLAGCAAPMLPYTPERQPEGVRLSAAYQLLSDRLRIEIDTDHRRLEDVWIVRTDGTAIRPLAIENAPVVTAPGPTFGIGVGGASVGHSSAVGSGVGVSVPVGSGPSRIEGTTYALFPLEPVGPPPWRLHLKVDRAAPTSILVGGPPPPR